ncbi:MFS transporter, MHS family, alpha-ketoglutarate permease [Chitinophaga terrae (ex Kim and Jung 2007)]|uniref:MFS transporter, MHS family, alpha-ketoglutarate permease n=1 Tax=Chitinophaga terrae (ex Kim and Jung 2007) TaxID=408074 RepID=A0A1H4ANI7_9BACT|nr:MFS transporter [Chitinophaga terrae (ex Kim and Jung 2007)]GEP89237.1 MFS transporter [Chitinophaga terrae (ex Kim and Jung 2007)]SEA37398.1 MFS transporter, MHS family, alpha-ketoglutarate permease [Chitinophaga terrae (ex Kim and Jung 2007)]
MKHPDAWRIKAILTGSAGNLVEWYDWYIYSTFSLYFAPVFFPKGNYTAQLLNTAAIFAVGFLMRPIGGWFFGRIADRSGRKAAMILSVFLMSMGSLLIAFTPSFDTVGVSAPILLLVARLIQGLSVGGEYGTSATYLSEVATSDLRGFYSSFQYVTMIGGQLTALGVQMLLQKLFLTPDQLHEWGWRIPFVIGAALAFFVLYLRRHMQESAAYEKIRNERDKGTLKRLFKEHPRAVLTVVGLTMGGTLAFYTYTTYMQKFLVNTVHLTIERSTTITFFLMLIFACLQPLFGWISDSIGRKPLLIGFGVAGILFSVPILTAVSHASSEWTAFWLILAALVIVSGYTSINAVVKAEMFPAEVRALGVGFPYAITVALFGGTAESVALYFKKIGHEPLYYWYVTACICCSLLVYVFSVDTKKTSLLDKDV